MNTNFKLKIVRTWIPYPNPDLAIWYWALLLMISFEDLALVYYIWVLKHNNKGQHEKITNINNKFVLFLGIYEKKKNLWV